MSAHRPTRAAAFRALCDWRVPPLEAMRAYARTVRGKGGISEAFEMVVAEKLRAAGEDADALARWEAEGGVRSGYA